MSKFIRLLAVFAVFAVLGLVVPALAVTPDQYDERRGITDRYSVSLGSFLVDFDTVARLDSEDLGQGTTIDFEDLLNLDTSATDVRLDAYVRFGRRHRLELGYVTFRRGVRVQIDEPIQYGEEIYDVDAEVDVDFNTSVAKVAYKYSIVNNGNVEAGLSFGVSAFSIEASILAVGSVAPGSGEVSGDLREKESTTAPVPLLGAHVNWTIRPKLFLRGSFEFLDVSVDDVSGRVTDAKVTVDYFPWEHFGFGGGYNKVSVDVTEESAPEFFFDYEYDGFLVYGTAIF